MLTWPWWSYSIIAALLWGLHFNLVVRVSRLLPNDIYTPLTLFFVTSLSMLLILPFTWQRVFCNIVTLYRSGPETRLSLLLLIFTTLVAAVLLYIAMRMSNNPTVAGAIDITYPFFVALIAWLVFRENQVDWSVIVGGILIFSGSFLIIWKHG